MGIARASSMALHAQGSAPVHDGLCSCQGLHALNDGTEDARHRVGMEAQPRGRKACIGNPSRNTCAAHA
eukprot:364886-Chlamydomonas_euryale.AAC.4